MIVRKTVVLNGYEPSPLSFRAPLGMDTRLHLSYFYNSGAVYDSDVAAQLQLTGRSSARTATYPLPATDIANGRAMAFIPGSDLADPNGYRLRLLGTANGEPSVLALGTVMPIPSAGMEVMPADVIDTVDLIFDYNNPAELDVSVWKDASKGSEYDMTADGTAVTATVTDSKGGAQLVPFTVTVIDANTVRLTLTTAQVNALPASCWWSMVAANSAGATTLCEGVVTVHGTPVP
jgi:hypothetical protein